MAWTLVGLVDNPVAMGVTKNRHAFFFAGRTGDLRWFFSVPVGSGCHFVAKMVTVTVLNSDFDIRLEMDRILDVMHVPRLIGPAVVPLPKSMPGSDQMIAFEDR